MSTTMYPVGGPDGIATGAASAAPESVEGGGLGAASAGALEAEPGSVSGFVQAPSAAVAAIKRCMCPSVRERTPMLGDVRVGAGSTSGRTWSFRFVVFIGLSSHSLEAVSPAPGELWHPQPRERGGGGSGSTTA